MDEQFLQQQRRYDQTWQKGLQAGKEQRGNLQTNLEFLRELEFFKPPAKVLEIGCGIGTVCQELRQQGFYPIGTDISNEAIEYGKSKYPELELFIQPAEKLPYEKESFSYVLSFDVLEHIKEVDRHVSEVFRVLKPGGRYLFQTPNKYSNVIFETLKSRSLKWRISHPSLHSPRQLRSRLVRHGFVDIRFVKMNTINEFTLRKFGKLAFLVRWMDFRRFPLWMQTNLYVIARKGEA